jgi:tetratricopeptide (TPR) repeat protein
MKIAVYGICLNEAPFVARFAASAAAADLIQVADTGSTDGSVAAFEAAGVAVTAIRVRPWRFDDARNAALALLPDDIDICVSLDLDTVLLDGWREALEAAWAPGTNLAYYNHILGRRPNGDPIQFVDNRGHARHGVRWKSPCHEYLVFDRTEERSVGVGGALMEQFPDKRKSRGQYLPLLKLAVEEAPNDARAAHVLARELRNHGRHGEAIVKFERYLRLVASTPEERSMSMRLLAMSHLSLGDHQAALTWFRRAAEDQPQLQGAWIDLACALYQQKDWRGCLDACVKAMETPLVVSEYGAYSDSGAMPEDMASVCAFRLGRQQEAVAFARRGAAEGQSSGDGVGPGPGFASQTVIDVPDGVEWVYSVPGRSRPPHEGQAHVKPPRSMYPGLRHDGGRPGLHFTRVGGHCKSPGGALGRRALRQAAFRSGHGRTARRGGLAWPAVRQLHLRPDRRDDQLPVPARISEFGLERPVAGRIEPERVGLLGRGHRCPAGFDQPDVRADRQHVQHPHVQHLIRPGTLTPREIRTPGG